MGESPEIDVLGWKLQYPRTWVGFFWSLSIFTTVAVALWIILVEARISNLRTVTSIMTHSVTPDGKIQDSVATRQLGFWTPSESTWSDLNKYYTSRGDTVPARMICQQHGSEARQDSFAA